MTKNLPLNCSTESTEWANLLNGLSLSPEWGGGDIGNKGSYFLDVESPSAFLCSLSSCPAHPLLKFLPVLYTTVQPLQRSNKEEIVHMVR